MLEYIQDDLRVIHGDLKANNLLTFDRGAVLKVADFGCAVNRIRGDIFADVPHPGTAFPARTTQGWRPRHWWLNSKAKSVYADRTVDLFAVAYILLEIMFCDCVSIVSFARMNKCLPLDEVIFDRLPSIVFEGMDLHVREFTRVVSAVLVTGKGLNNRNT